MVNILIVDDVRDDAVLAERVLRRSEVLNPIRILSGGNECIRYFTEQRSAKGNTSEGLFVLLDMMMQPTDGLAVLRTLKDKNLAGDSIIVMLSGVNDLKTIQAGYQLGARSYLQKPFKPEDVTQVLESLSSKISIHPGPMGNLLHWVSTPASQQLHDSELIRRSGDHIMRF